MMIGCTTVSYILTVYGVSSLWIKMVWILITFSRRILLDTKSKDFCTLLYIIILFSWFSLISVHFIQKTVKLFIKKAVEDNKTLHDYNIEIKLLLCPNPQRINQFGGDSQILMDRIRVRVQKKFKLVTLKPEIKINKNIDQLTLLCWFEMQYSVVVKCGLFYSKSKEYKWKMTEIGCQE